MKLLVMLVCEIDEPEDTVSILEAINPPAVPKFSGDVHLTIDPWASQIVQWLRDNDDENVEFPLAPQS